MSDAIRAKIAELENEYARTQKNKATEQHLGLIKAKLAKLRRELIQGQSRGGGGGGGERAFEVSKAGDTRIGLVGFPSVGKSTLLTKLTGTFSEAAAYEFTTLTAIPGTLHYRGARIQVVDLPGIIEGARDGKGRGRQVISSARTCNLLLIVLDASKPMTHLNKIMHELDGFGIRLNQEPPDVIFRKKDRGGINYTTQCPQSQLTREIVSNILREFRVACADVVLRQDTTIDQFIDVVEGNRKYMPAIYVLNKIDSITIEDLDVIAQLDHHVPISAHHGWNLDELLETVWDRLKMIRIYTKPRGQIPDYDAPVVLHAESPTVEQFCNKIHRSLIQQFKHALVWGTSAKHQPQRVGRDHRLHDEDIVQIVKQGARA